VREYFLKNHIFTYKRVTANVGYVEFVIPYEQAKDVMSANKVHMFPRPSYYMTGLPNEDGSITMNAYLPLDGEVSWKTINSN
jgi:kynurenine 3-monooxygenase